MQTFIGHDGWAMMADKSFYFADQFDWICLYKSIKKNTDIPKTIYLKIDVLPQHLELLLSLQQDFVLITGCSDYCPHVNFKHEYARLIKHPFLKRWYAENNLVEHDKMRSLPVGLSIHSVQDEETLLQIRRGIDVQAKLDTILCCWRPRTSNCCGSEYVERGSMTEFVHSYPHLFAIESASFSKIEFQKKLSKYKYCLCPLGNGVDAGPKITECFFLKTIPIVRKTQNCWNLYKNYPVVWVNNFQELLSMSLHYDLNIDWDHILQEFTCDHWVQKIKAEVS